MENIKKISAQRLGKNRLQARTVVTKDNVMQLSEIVRLVASLRLDKLTLQLVLNSWAKNDMEEINKYKRITMDPTYETQIKQAQAVAEQLGLALDITSDDKYSRQRKCNWPWKSAYISSNGDVVPCCILADSDTVKMGNVFEQDFKDIWNSEAYQTLRKQIRDHDLPHFCTNCYIDA
jgi:radical SAM protein with 4Fe4S-binding SPASM domain